MEHGVGFGSEAGGGRCLFLRNLHLARPLHTISEHDGLKGKGEDHIEHPFFFVLDHANPQSSQHHLAAALTIKAGGDARV